VILTLWTADPGLARRADAAGVDRIGIDLDRLGKRERQAGLATWISPHTTEDLVALRPAVTRARLFARCNPPHEGSAAEVEALLAAGAEVLMLPMFRSACEAAAFGALVGGRATVVALLETAAALADVAALAEAPGVDEVHLGINDLALELGLGSRFEVLTLDAVAAAAAVLAEAGRPFGLGGIAHPGAQLPIDPDLIYAQYPRLGADRALLARSFTAGTHDLGREVRRVRARLRWWAGRAPAELERAREDLALAAGRPGAPF
jgi:hypothetical protein